MTLLAEALIAERKEMEKKNNERPYPSEFLNPPEVNIETEKKEREDENDFVRNVPPLEQNDATFPSLSIEYLLCK